MSRTPHAGTRLRVTSLDILLAGTIVCLCVALCVRDIVAFSDKARLATVFIWLPAEREDTHEQFAVTGRLSASESVVPLEKQASASLSFDVVPDGSGLLVKGTVGPDVHPFAVSFVPALSDDGEGSVRWLCGMQRTPAGWHAAGAARMLQLPHGASYSICRDDDKVGP